MRLDHLVSQTPEYGARKQEARAMIAAGRVAVDGVVVTSP
jgi:ribosomal protein S4E